jgi:hypothetical protein
MSNVTRTCVALVAFLSFTAVSEEPSRAPPGNAAKVHQTDRYGNVQYHKPSMAAESDGRIVPVDTYGNRQHQKPGMRVEGDKVHQTDRYGNVQHHKPGYTVEPDGRVIQTDPYGNKQYQNPQYRIQDGKVYETDAFGGRKQQAYTVKPSPAASVTDRSQAEPDQAKK